MVGLNEVLDEGLPFLPLEEQRNSVRDWRQIGLGVMGIADMLIKLEIPYGSDDSLVFCDTVAKALINQAAYSSACLAVTHGSFPKFRVKDFTASPFFKENLNDNMKKAIEENGIYNSQLLCIAPTGSLSTMLGISGGIEPVFANYYNRKTESLYNKDKTFKVYTPIVKEYMESHNLVDDSQLPDYFVTAANLNYTQRIKMQAVWQRYIDASISSTINLPEEATVEEVMDIYMKAWEDGLKGVTIFRNNCQRAGILTTDNKKEAIKSEKIVSRPIIYDSIIPVSRKTIGTTHGNTYCKKSACGTLYITVNCDDDGEVVETFVESSKGGICKANTAAVNRMISLALRSGVKVDEIIDQLRGIDCPACSKTNKAIDGLSCPDIIARAIKAFYYGEEDTPNKKIVKSKKAVELKEVEPQEDSKCPDCGASIRRDGGCVICPACGWSRCS